MKIILGGVHASGAGYPNAINTVAILRNRLHVEVIECGHWLSGDQHLWKVMSRAPISRATTLLKLGLRNLASVFRVMRSADRRSDIVYVPYPSLPFMWWMSWVPRRFRPRCVVDAYILLWDAVVRDRGKLAEYGIAATLLKIAEGRAMRAASRVLVDTTANGSLLIDNFRLEKKRVVALPLAIERDVEAISTHSSKPSQKKLRVLFIGTFVPLHGIEMLAQGINLLKDDPSIEFRIVGDGQAADRFESLLDADARNFQWHRGWVDMTDVRREIGCADICLGVFGGSGKAARVLPLKLYHYMACGKAVVTQREISMPAGVPSPPFVLVDPADPTALANALRKLASSPADRDELARQSREFYERYLSNDAIAAGWRRLLDGLTSASAATLF